ncbi:MAG: ribokinase [Bryobacterales bacterium]|nr:ribokinase [Bryobacterales bacterium]
MNLEAILSGFRARRALVVGDICLDRWCRYDPALAERSRETGIPRIAVVGGELTPGAGGTVANNLVALGTGEVAVLGVLGDDGHGWELRRALTARGIGHELCFAHADFATFTYTKLLNVSTNQEEDQPRVDFVNTKPLPADAEGQLVGRLEEAAPSFDVILVSDQAETGAGGVITAAVREALGRIAAQEPEKVIWVDSRLRPEHFRGVILKPNEDEAKAACERAGVDGFAALRELTGSRLLLVTHGARGVMLVGADGAEEWVATVAVEKPVDICGAGDSFSAGAAVAYSITREAAAAAQFGNLVASITIMKKGTGTASPEELRAAYARWAK